MIRPLYNDSENIIPNKCGDGNTGLWYDKFCNQWCRDKKQKGLYAWTLKSFATKDDQNRNIVINPKIDWINTVVGLIGNKDLIELYIERREKFFNEIDVSASYFKLTSDFVTGLGREHPAENGFAWHHTLGSPYLPGSSVKGMVRAWASQWNDDETKDNETIDRVFGSQDKVGTVIFMDALPLSKVQLKADIMTPHYSPYYQARLEDVDKNPPADWYSPTPIPFLVVAKGATFQFGILPRNPGCEQCKKDCQTAEKWLTDALQWIGAGAKTAVGYGRFEPDLESENQLKLKMEKEKQNKENNRKIQQALQGKSEIAKKLIEQSIKEGWDDKRDPFVKDGIIDNWLNDLENDLQPDAIAIFIKFFDKHCHDMQVKYKLKKLKKDRQVKVVERVDKLKAIINISKE